MRYILVLMSVFALMTQAFPANASFTYLNRILAGTSKSMDKSTKRLSSGYYQLTDDPSGAAVFEALESHIRGLDKSVNNTEDMISYYRYIDGALSGVISSMQRIRELAIGLGNGMLSDIDKDIIKSEMKGHYDQIVYTLKTGQFNTKPVFKKLLASKAFKGIFYSARFYSIGNIDMLLKYFIKERVIAGVTINRLRHRASTKEIEKENIERAQSRSDVNYATEMSNFKRQQLMMMVNIMMLKKKFIFEKKKY